MTYLIQGWLLGIAYVAPIGMQNMYLINTAVEKKRSHALRVALIMIFLDITLALACFFGIGVLLEQLTLLRFVVMGIGSLAIVYIGFSLIKAKPTTASDKDFGKTFLEIFVACFIVTWLNPQAIVDGTLLIGGYRASLTDVNATWFILGVIIASTTWFLSVTMIVSTFRQAFNLKVLKVINVICGSILILFGLKLAYAFIISLF